MSELPRIGIYRLLSECGSGACGTVYLAENTLTGRRFALKILRGKYEKRELDGLIRCRECRHPGLIQIHHVDRTPDGALYYTMDAADSRSETEYVPDTLAARLENNPYPSAELKDIILRLADGAEALHRAGLIHRDIKPENIFFVHGAPVLGDIGLTAEPGNASVAGTPAFMPPEVLQGKRPADESADFYALGMTAYCALTGFSPADFPCLPKGLPPDAGPLIAAACAACEGKVAPAQFRDMLTGKLRPGRHSRRIRIAVSAAVLISVLILAAGVWFRLKDDTSPAQPPAAGADLPFERKLDELLGRYPEPPPALKAKAEKHYQESPKPVPQDDPLARLGELNAQIPLIAENAKRFPDERQLSILKKLLDEREKLSRTLK